MSPTGDSDLAKIFMDIVYTRRSVRRYKPEKIPLDHIRIIMEAAQRAPTDAALHLWTAIHVRDDEKKRRIAELTGQRHIDEGSDFFLFIADLYRLKKLLEYRGEEMGDVDHALLLFAAIDAGLAAENMALAAVSLGYGTCFIGAIHNATEEIIELLKLPKKTYPLFGLVVGVPDEEPPLRPRLPLEMLFHSEEYHDYSEDMLDEGYKAMAPITRRGDYLRLLKRYVGREGYFVIRNKELPRLLEKMGFKINP
ncbi:MAG: nitroreductase family protein [Desulfurococcales archaeon]|nr:nitroreductase family protein [Desulfurococcales archaeon]